MKQEIFDNLFKVILLIMFGIFLYQMSDRDKPTINNNGRFQYIEKQDEILDTHTGILYQTREKGKVPEEISN